MACRPWTHGDSKAVDFVTPTLGRADVHEQLHGVFDSQTIRQKRLFVLDESEEPSRFFSRLRDPRVIYRHEPNRKITGAGQGGIARARNRLMRMTSASITAHMDDDDVYAPAWAETMLERLKGYDLAKLVNWHLMRESDGSIWAWDTRTFQGEVFAVKGGEPVERVNVEDDPPPPDIRKEMQEAWILGFGFSYVFRRDLWERLPFDENESTEDIPWVRRALKHGARVNLVADLPHLVLHVVHPRSDSVNFPQRRVSGLPRLLSGIPDDGRRELPKGKAIAVAAGKTVAVLASLKDKHSLKSLFSRCAAWKVTVLEARDKIAPEEFGAEPAPGGYRLVYVVGKSERSGVLPWGVPSPLNVFDKSSCVRAWALP